MTDRIGIPFSRNPVKENRVNIGEESDPIEVPMPVHPDDVPAGTPAPEPVVPEKVPANG